MLLCVFVTGVIFTSQTAVSVISELIKEDNLSNIICHNINTIIQVIY